MENYGLKVIDVEKIAKKLAERKVCTEKEALEYLVTEDKYYDEIGLNVYDPHKIFEEVMSGNLSSSTVVDQLEVEKYIAEHSELSSELVEKISMYMFENKEEMIA